MSWSAQLQLGIKSPDINDVQRVDLIMDYLLQTAPNFCFDADRNRFQSCSCLSCLNVESSRNAVALYILWFSDLEKQTQQLIIMEKIRGTKLVLKPKQHGNQPLYFLPYKTELTEVANELQDFKLCKFAMMALLRYGKTAWSTCKLAVENGTVPEHGLKGKANVRSKKFKQDVEPGLKAFFATVVLPLSGPRPTRFTRQESGAITRDSEDMKELDPEWTKRRLFGRYCYDLGFNVEQSASGAVKIHKREDEEYPAGGGAEYGSHCSLTAFWNYWEEHYGNIVVRKPSKDICGVCYQFHLGNRKAVAKTSDTDPVGAITNTSSTSDDDEANDDNDGTEGEREDLETLEVANKIKNHIEDATSMRELSQKAIEDAKTATRDNVLDQDLKITLVVDYCQNMEMPFFGKDQPGETYYYTPKTINLLGIVDCNPEKEVLHAYAYSEEEGGKGGNNVASLLMKHLKDRGFLDGTQRKQLNIVMDNCPGQNKNNIVLRLSPYLQEKGYFLEVNFIFLVVGHTKNVADRLFNTLKRLYRKMNIFSMNMLIEVLKHEQVIPYKVDWRDFKDWDKYLSRIYKKLSSVLKWQMFQSSSELGVASIFFKSSNVENATSFQESVLKLGVTGDQRNAILLEEEPVGQYRTKPGLRDIKQVELWKKYRPLVPEEFRDELCPMPPKEILDGEKNRKNMKSKLMRVAKKEKKEGKKESEPSPKIVVATTASTASKSENDQQELTNNGIFINPIAPSSPLKRSREDGVV
jgi:hypothetical protein